MKLVDSREFPKVGEMYEGKPMTPARHARLICEQLIVNEEASGDPELWKVAQFRRRCLGQPSNSSEERVNQIIESRKRNRASGSRGEDIHLIERAIREEEASAQAPAPASLQLNLFA